MDDIPARDILQPSDSDAEERTGLPLRIVGIGAGAGGLEAVQLLFGAMPLDTNIAFVICRRLRPGLVDPLASLLRTQTAMPVVQATNGTELEGDRIHLVSPEARMILVKNRLVSLEAEQVDDPDLYASPIDLLLHSLAASAGPAAIAVILSGHERDGQRGCSSVREYGGLVLAQHPESTDFSEMPNHVIEADLASAVASPGAMPDLIWRHIGHSRRKEAIPRQDGRDETALIQITARLEEKFGIDAHAYRPSLVARRVRRRLSLSKLTALSDYAELIVRDDAELAALHDDLMIRVTAFFRDPEAFEAMKHEVAPVLIERMTEERPIRIWVPACASGEEAYSIAMLFLDRIANAGKAPHLDILASDRHEAALRRARQGRYRRDRLGNVPPGMIETYMTGSGEHREIGSALRRHVTFVDHDMLKAEPPDDIDLVSCRNLLIYLAAGSRDKVLLACSKALRPDGFLCLGSSEQPGPLAAGFATVDSKWRLYRKIPPPPVHDALGKMAEAQQRLPAEVLDLPLADEFPSLDTPLAERQPDGLDGVMSENLRMLEGTIDTLLASNDTLRRRNRDLRSENQQLASAHAALDDVATMIAHDLKTPLRTVENLTKRLKAALAQDDPPPDPARWLQPMQHQIIGLTRLIDDLLTYARQGPADSADITPVDMGDLLREALTLIGLPKGVKVAMQPSSLQVKTWRIPLACVLRNLLGQALQRIGADTGSIRIDVKQNDRFLDMAITDDGKYGEDRTGSLGLAIVRQLLDAVGGRLAQEHDKSQGTHRVRITWPIERATPRKDAGKASTSA